MIIIYNGERQIYHPQNPNLKLVSPKLTLEDNAAGSLTFKVYDSNLNYDTIRKLYPVISVVRDGKTLFKGRVISDRKDFYNGKSVEVEGKLAFFNDSYIEPFSFSGSPEALFRMVVENHNSQVMWWQQFKVGMVTVTDANDYVVRSSENILNSWEILKSRCFQSALGGHIRVRYEDDGDYIDWLADYDAVSKQGIAFARNMIDMSLEMDATETYTAIRPVGAEVDGVKIDISSVNDGKTYLVNEEKAAEYGIIYAPEKESSWEDVTLPKNLLKKAEEKLYGSFATLKETYEIKAVDLNLTDKDIEALNICEYVPVISRPHNINGNYLLSKADICIAEPQNSVFYLGSSKRVFSDMNSGGTTVVTVPRNISSFENDAGYISEEKTEKLLSDYTKAEEVEEIVSQAVSQIPSGENGLSAYEIAVVYGFAGTEEEWLASLEGRDGENGFSPTIVENPENTEDIYKLDITTESGTFTTPNLIGPKGADGTGGGTTTPIEPDIPVVPDDGKVKWTIDSRDEKVFCSENRIVFCTTKSLFDTSGELNLSLSTNVNESKQIILSIEMPERIKLGIYLNDDIVFSYDYYYKKEDVKISLKKGENKLKFVISTSIGGLSLTYVTIQDIIKNNVYYSCELPEVNGVTSDFIERMFESKTTDKTTYQSNYSSSFIKFTLNKEYYNAPFYIWGSPYVYYEIYVNGVRKKSRTSSSKYEEEEQFLTSLISGENEVEVKFKDVSTSYTMTLDLLLPDISDYVDKDTEPEEPTPEQPDNPSGNVVGLFAFEIKEDGHLYVISESEVQAQKFSINEQGHLIYNIGD